MLRTTLLRRSAAALSFAVVVSSCGGGASSDTTSPTGGEEPRVEIPSSIPSELVVTDLTEGTGEAAAQGDTLFVYYVGVRSEDGTRFDGNYGGTPFPVTLGAGSVIDGWEQGLVGVKKGGVRQLDIPADLAYGDEARGDVIKAGDALSFVITVDTIIPAVTVADEPDVTVEGAGNAESVSTKDLVEGEGTAVAAGQTAVFHLIAYRGDTGDKIDSSWEVGAPLAIALVEGQTLPGFVKGIPGMKVGGRREIRVPFLDAFGAEGSPSVGLPASTDLVLVIDLVAVY